MEPDKESLHSELCNVKDAFLETNDVENQSPNACRTLEQSNPTQYLSWPQGKPLGIFSVENFSSPIDNAVYVDEKNEMKRSLQDELEKINIINEKENVDYKSNISPLDIKFDSVSDGDTSTNILQTNSQASDSDIANCNNPRVDNLQQNNASDTTEERANTNFQDKQSAKELNSHPVCESKRKETYSKNMNGENQSCVEFQLADSNHSLTTNPENETNETLSKDSINKNESYEEASSNIFSNNNKNVKLSTSEVDSEYSEREQDLSFESFTNNEHILDNNYLNTNTGRMTSSLNLDEVGHTTSSNLPTMAILNDHSKTNENSHHQISINKDVINNDIASAGNNNTQNKCEAFEDDHKMSSFSSSLEQTPDETKTLLDESSKTIADNSANLVANINQKTDFTFEDNVHNNLQVENAKLLDHTLKEEVKESINYQALLDRDNNLSQAVLDEKESDDLKKIELEKPNIDEEKTLNNIIKSSTDKRNSDTDDECFEIISKLESPTHKNSEQSKISQLNNMSAPDDLINTREGSLDESSGLIKASDAVDSILMKETNSSSTDWAGNSVSQESSKAILPREQNELKSDDLTENIQKEYSTNSCVEEFLKENSLLPILNKSPEAKDTGRNNLKIGSMDTEVNLNLQEESPKNKKTYDLDVHNLTKEIPLKKIDEQQSQKENPQDKTEVISEEIFEMRNNNAFESAEENKDESVQSDDNSFNVSKKNSTNFENETENLKPTVNNKNLFKNGKDLASNKTNLDHDSENNDDIANDLTKKDFLTNLTVNINDKVPKQQSYTEIKSGTIDYFNLPNTDEKELLEKNVDFQNDNGPSTALVSNNLNPLDYKTAKDDFIKDTLENLQDKDLILKVDEDNTLIKSEDAISQLSIDEIEEVNLETFDDKNKLATNEHESFDKNNLKSKSESSKVIQDNGHQVADVKKKEFCKESSNSASDFSSSLTDFYNLQTKESDEKTIQRAINNELAFTPNKTSRVEDFNINTNLDSKSNYTGHQMWGNNLEVLPYHDDNKDLPFGKIENETLVNKDLDETSSPQKELLNNLSSIDRKIPEEFDQINGLQNKNQTNDFTDRENFSKGFLDDKEKTLQKMETLKKIKTKEQSSLNKNFAISNKSDTDSTSALNNYSSMKLEELENHFETKIEPQLLEEKDKSFNGIQNENELNEVLKVDSTNQDINKSTLGNHDVIAKHKIDKNDETNLQLDVNEKHNINKAFENSKENSEKPTFKEESLNAQFSNTIEDRNASLQYPKEKNINLLDNLKGVPPDENLKDLITNNDDSGNQGGNILAKKEPGNFNKDNNIDPLSSHSEKLPSKSLNLNERLKQNFSGQVEDPFDTQQVNTKTKESEPEKKDLESSTTFLNIGKSYEKDIFSSLSNPNLLSKVDTSTISSKQLDNDLTSDTQSPLTKNKDVPSKNKNVTDNLNILNVEAKEPIQQRPPTIKITAANFERVDNVQNKNMKKYEVPLDSYRSEAKSDKSRVKSQAKEDGKRNSKGNKKGQRRHNQRSNTFDLSMPEANYQEQEKQLSFLSTEKIKQFYTKNMDKIKHSIEETFKPKKNERHRRPSF